MTSIKIRAARGVVAFAIGASAAACSHSAPQTTPAPQAVSAPSSGGAAAASEQAAIAQARADSARHPYTNADVQFMQGMIEHHAQAIAMSKMAPTHGASPSVQTLAARIINAQRDEIGLMQQWLRDRQKTVPVPDTLGTGSGMMMAMSNGGDHQMNGAGDGHSMLMPGMLTPEQMHQLDAARGTDFDRLFLTDMIQHHRGALTMVKQLFDSYGAAQDDLVFKLSSNANVDQQTEIARMQRMLIGITFGQGGQ